MSSEPQSAASSQRRCASFAGAPVRFTLRLTNLGRLPRRALLVKISSAAAPILFGRLDPGRSTERGVDLVFPKRGRRSIESLLLYSGYPIGLFRKGRVHPLGDERLVYPASAYVPYVPPDPLGGWPPIGGEGPTTWR